VESTAARMPICPSCGGPTRRSSFGESCGGIAVTIGAFWRSGRPAEVSLGSSARPAPRACPAERPSAAALAADQPRTPLARRPPEGTGGAPADVEVPTAARWAWRSEPVVSPLRSRSRRSRGSNRDSVEVRYGPSPGPSGRVRSASHLRRADHQPEPLAVAPAPPPSCATRPWTRAVGVSAGPADALADDAGRVARQPATGPLAGCPNGYGPDPAPPDAAGLASPPQADSSP
jgi:hypothetical protein